MASNLTAILKEHFPEGLSKGTKEEPKKSPGFHYSDVGNAEWLVHRYGKDIRYVPQWGKWLNWQGGRWKEDITGDIVRKAIAAVKALYQEASYEEDDKERRKMVSHALRSEADGRIKAMINLAKTKDGIPVTTDELDADHWKLNCLNGVVNLKDGKILPHEREYLMTKIAPVTYNESATCPTWEAFLHRIMGGNQELIDFLQKAIGYSLTGDISEQVMFILHGSGRNGKSTFVNVIRELLGDYADQANPESFMVKKNESISNDVAALKGLRFVSVAEAEEGKRLAESLIKQLTGGEAIKARFLRQEFFTFLPAFKIWFSTNHRPMIRGTDNGIWRRIRLIPFNVTIPVEEVDKDLPEKLKAEYPGILRWAIEGCMKWKKEGLGLPKEIESATESYRSEMDALAAFIDDCCTVNPLAKVNATDLYRTYQKWCEENGEYSLNQRVFGLRLSERGYEKRKSTGNKTFYFGIGVQGDSPITDSYPKTNPFEKKVIPFDESQRKVTQVTGFEEGEL